MATYTKIDTDIIEDEGELSVSQTDQTHSVIFKEKSYHDILGEELGERYWDYRKRWDRASKCEIVQDYPLHLNFEIFYGCNFRCPFCILSTPIKDRGYKVDTKAKISFEKYCEIIDEGVKHGLCAVQLNGYNEPFLLKDIARYIRYAKNAGVLDIYVVSNGSALKPEMAEEIIDAGLTQIKFSIDSLNRETYSKMRVGGDFDVTMRNINHFLEVKKKLGKKLPITRVSFLKAKENINELDDFINYWVERVDYITIQDMINPFLDDPEKYKKFEESLRLKKIEFKECPIPYQRLIIRNDGSVLPCCTSYGYKLPLGNINQSSIYDIWNSDKTKNLRNKINGGPDSEPLPCKKCRSSF
ncbi:MAG: radical SAM protein [Candidatus Omnitrophica bacterium]|nr:radical SAM protein [Candidatus Omnitrophota bacterium]